MKTRKPVLLIISLFILVSIQIHAAGITENEKEYNEALEQEFPLMIKELHAKHISAEEAKTELAGLRDKYEIPYTDKAGILDSIIDHTSEEKFSIEEAEFYFKHLKNGTLMAYRKETHIQKVISLIQNNFNNDREDLNSMLEHYYEFTGLEKDEYYYQIKETISSAGSSAALIKSELEKIKREAVRSGSSFGAEENKEPSGSSDADKPQAATQKPAGSDAGAEAQQPSTGGQSSSGSGAKPRR